MSSDSLIHFFWHRESKEERKKERKKKERKKRTKKKRTKKEKKKERKKKYDFDNYQSVLSISFIWKVNNHGLFNNKTKNNNKNI